MKLNKNELDEKYINILTTNRVNDIIEKQNLNLKLTKDEHIWFDRQFGVRRANLKFAHTKKELEEYTKCKMDIHYFADNYCQIKREDGTIGPMKLRDYQKDILDLYANNRYSILMASRQMGKCNSLISKVLVKDNNGKEFNITIGELYYTYIQQERKLTLIEILKLFLYKILSFL
ncbi:hypothetical protein [Trichloromonas sp.]|jgi:hypothetical protein|uniref:hypothetical protein n=1 Tax=Trichloromonas sp. TaxID=3069249 RepID=UPI002A49D7D1|nr:hypothetical protein [Trichloromonas sp.]